MWDSDVITGNEIMEQLVQQYGVELPISFSIEDMNAPIPYRSTILKFQCNRCGNVISTTPKCALTARETSGYICMECQGKTDQEIRELKREKMLSLGTEVVEKAEREGRIYDPKKEAGNMDDETGYEYSVEDLDDRVLSTEEMQQLDQEEVDAIVQDHQKEMQQVQPESEPEQPKPVVTKTKKQKDIEKYSVDSEDDDKITLGAMLKSKNPDFLIIEGKKNDDHAKERKQERVNRREDNNDDHTTESFEEQAETTNNLQGSTAADSGNDETDSPILVDNDSVEADGIPEDIRKEMDRRADELKQQSKESVQPQQKEEPIVVQDDITQTQRVKQKPAWFQKKMENERKEQDEEKPVIAKPKQTAPVKKPVEQKVVAPQPKPVQQPKENLVTIDGLKYSINQLGVEIVKLLTRIERGPLGHVPFKGISIDPITKQFTMDDDAFVVEPDLNGAHFTCEACGKEVPLTDFKSLSEDVLVVDNEWCEARNVQVRPDACNVLQNCPHCIESFLTYGYNKYNADRVKERLESNGLELVDPDTYYYFNNNAYYFVRPIGRPECIPTQIDYRAFCDTFPIGKDLSKHEIFTKVIEQPKQSVIVESEKQEQPSNDKPLDVEMGVLPEFKGDLSFFGVNSSVDSETVLKESFDEKNGTEGFTGLHRGFKIKRAKENDAKFNPNINPFERKSALENEFSRSVFNDFIAELAEITEVQFKLIISDRAFDIPIVDFESGIRIVCADLDERAMINVPYLNIVDAIKFHFKKRYKSIVLFSDSIVYRRQATLDALVKHINPSVLEYNGQKIDITKWGLFHQYTTYAPFLSDFDQKYSTFPSGKPKTGQLGIVVSWEETSQNSLKDAMALSSLLSSGSGRSLESFENDYNQYLVASIRYIERFNKKTNRIIYHITEYTEIGSAIIADGFLLCLRGLLKEYQQKYPQFATIPPHVVVEIDANTYFSPSLLSYIEKKSLVPMDTFYKMQIEDRYFPSNSMKPPVEQHHRYSYIRKVEYRVKDKDCMRWDMRMFQPGTLINRMAEEIKQAGLQDSIFDDNVRMTFIYNMGYAKATQLDIKEFFVSQSLLSLLMTDAGTISLTKMVDPKDYLNTKMVADTTSGRNINNILLNPSALNRYQNIMNKGSLEARNYLQSALYQTQMGSMDQMNGMQMQQQMPMNNGMMMQQPMMGMPGMTMPMMQPQMQPPFVGPMNQMRF